MCGVTRVSFSRCAVGQESMLLIILVQLSSECISSQGTARRRICTEAARYLAGAGEGGATCPGCGKLSVSAVSPSPSHSQPSPEAAGLASTTGEGDASRAGAVALGGSSLPAAAALAGVFARGGEGAAPCAGSAWDTGTTGGTPDWANRAEADT